MNNDLISRSKLKEEINSTIAQATKVGIMVDTNYLWELLNYAIDNAPAVEYPFYQEAYQTGYEEGKNERPQGECKSCKYYHPYYIGYSDKPRGDGYCVIARMTPEGMTTINCNDEFGCSDYQKGGAE